MPVAIALAIELTVAFTSPLSWLFVLVAIANGLLFDTVLFTSEESPTTIAEIVLSHSAVLVAAYLADVVNRARAVEARSRDVVARLDGAVRQLTEANVSLQECAARSSSEERWRISREVHDTVGYALTNRRMMMELAQRITPDELTELKEIHRRGVEQARQGINDVRAALGALRASEPRRLLGQQGITRLARSFEKATGVTVRIEYGNARASFGQHVDAAIDRLVQEGLTNALRHGKATRIDISFWQRDGLLEVALEDNGVGSKDVADGIGISGMRERIESLGGIIARSNSPVGFRLSATVPGAPTKPVSRNDR